MRESCTYGSVRGTRGNSRSYRDRRAFISLLAGASLALPGLGRAQERGRRVAALMQHSKDNAEVQGWLSAFQDGLQKLGWVEAVTFVSTTAGVERI